MKNHVSFYQATTHVVGTQKNHPTEITFLNTQNISYVAYITSLRPTNKSVKCKIIFQLYHTHNTCCECSKEPFDRDTSFEMQNICVAY